MTVGKTTAHRTAPSIRRIVRIPSRTATAAAAFVMITSSRNPLASGRSVTAIATTTGVGQKSTRQLRKARQEDGCGGGWKNAGYWGDTTTQKAQSKTDLSPFA